MYLCVGHRCVAAAWPEAAILYLVITIGVLFLVPGLFLSLSGHLICGKQDGSRFPLRAWRFCSDYG